MAKDVASDRSARAKTANTFSMGIPQCRWLWQRKASLFDPAWVAGAICRLRGFPATLLPSEVRREGACPASRQSGKQRAQPRGCASARCRVLVDIVGPAHAIADSDRQQPFLHELRGLYEGRAALVLRPGSTRRGRADPFRRQRGPHRRRPAGRQHRSRRRPDPISRREPGGAVAVAADARARCRCGGRHHDRRGRRHLGRRASRCRRAPIACFRSACRRRGAARSAACWRPTPAASACSPTAMRGR